MKARTIKFETWAAKWCAETGTSNPRLDYQCKVMDAETVPPYALGIKVDDPVRGADAPVTVYPNSVAEVCGYIGRGCHHGARVCFTNDNELKVEGGI